MLPKAASPETSAASGAVRLRKRRYYEWEVELLLSLEVYTLKAIHRFRRPWRDARLDDDLVASPGHASRRCVASNGRPNPSCGSFSSAVARLRRSVKRSVDFV